MPKEYYSLPFKPNAFISNDDHDKCSIQESISSFLHLLATTYFGECTFDESFGNALWEVDFDNLTSNDKLRAIITESILDSVEHYEKRLAKAAVEIKLRQESVTKNGNLQMVRKRIDILISGTIKQTNEPFSFVESFYIAPMSF
ncbi:GPW/gp25 family protein [uncultured Marixanthomonas sp.]|uniref:GPW/gp25 family protein n=1 Tax=uncultured Marixanthomonas sp. TaxID=757245 RepID=UPI0030DB035F|tara:strand:- start:19435 stop:19866 length:432 start_codon:yes stop_codon:yes gene_type:complete